jgi:hypothetical protein
MRWDPNSPLPCSLPGLPLWKSTRSGTAGASIDPAGFASFSTAVYPVDPPPAFASRMRAHNQNALIAALLSLLAALLAWFLLYQAGVWLLLLFRTILHGEDAQHDPRYPVIFFAAAGIFLIVFFIWRIAFPYRGPSDRPIFGWHLIPRFLFLPASLTLAVSDNLAAHQKLTKERMRAAFFALLEIDSVKKMPVTRLPLLGMDDDELHRVLLLLQYAGYIDLHRGRDGWFYRVRSTEEEEVRALRKAAEGH